MKRIPLTDSLSHTTARLRESKLDWERAGAASLLAGTSTAETIRTLEDLLLHDPSDQVKAAAARSLALVGDRSTMQMVQGYYDSAISRGELEDRPQLRRGLEKALERFAERFPD